MKYILTYIWISIDPGTMRAMGISKNNEWKYKLIMKWPYGSMRACLNMRIIKEEENRIHSAKYPNWQKTISADDASVNKNLIKDISIKNPGLSNKYIVGQAIKIDF